ncbi:MAG TPA: PAS domain S-box protein [Candidatus Acidoferrales bacterium]|nr:PAS domain S-box protein [Candidatus Acidoferrales bacterium]
MKIRTYLILLVVAAVLPVVVFASVMIFAFIAERTRSVDEGLLHAARALSVAVDREISGKIQALRALATSEHLISRELRKFYAEAARVKQVNPHWETILLIDSSGQQLVNLRVPFGEPLPRPPISELSKHVFSTGQPGVSNLFMGPIGKIPLLSVSVPVVVQGRVKYALTSSESPQVLQNLLLAQKMSPEWWATLVDRNKVTVARTRSFEQFFSKPVSPQFAQKIDETQEAVWKTRTREGLLIRTAHHRSELTGWVTAVAAPVSVVQAPIRRSLLTTAAGGLFLLLTGIGLAIFFGGKLATSMSNLSNIAKPLLEGNPAAAAAAAAAAAGTSGARWEQIAEVVQVARAIEDAALKRRHAEEAVRRNAQRLRNILDGLGPQMFVGLLTTDGKVIEANRPALAAAGLKSEEVLGRSVEDTYWFSYSEPIQRQLRDAIERAGRGEPSRYDVEIRVAESQFIVIDFSLQPLRDETGKIVFLVPSAIDITERKRAEEALRQSEEKYRTLTENLTDLIYRADPETFAATFVNRAVEDIYGYTVEQWLSEPLLWKNTIHPEDRERVLKLFADAARDAQNDLAEYRIIRKDGAERWVENRFSWEKARDGRVVALQGVLSDVTARRNAAAEIQRAKELLEQLTGYLQNVREEEKSRISREVHDELGQALTALKMDIAGIKSGPLPISALAKLESASKLIDATIEKVRQIATELRPGILDDLGLREALEWQTADFESRSGIKCTFVSNLKEPLDKKLSTALFRIAQESLTNVARHANATTVELSLLHDNGLLELSIQDNGRGIKMDRAAPSRESLGIMGMRERAALVGGSLEIDGIEGKGTKVTVRVPLTPSED